MGQLRKSSRRPHKPPPSTALTRAGLAVRGTHGKLRLSEKGRQVLRAYRVASGLQETERLVQEKHGKVPEATRHLLNLMSMPELKGYREGILAEIRQEREADLHKEKMHALHQKKEAQCRKKK